LLSFIQLKGSCLHNECSKIIFSYIFLFLVDTRSIFRPLAIDRFRVHSILNRNVCLLRLFPSITIQTVRALLHPPIEGIILQTYGSGNIPSSRTDLIEELRMASANGVLIINTTQCCHGSVSAIYETGAALSQAGVISGADMTPEAALTKLSYVLSKDDWDLDTKRQVGYRLHESPSI